MPLRCLVVDNMHPSIIPGLESIGIQVDYFPDITLAQIMQIIGDYEGLIVRSKLQVNLDLLKAALKLRFVARAGAGTDNIDVEELEKRKIKVLNAPEGNRDALAEHATGMLLGLLNKIHTAHQEVKLHQWNREENRGEELMGKTVGILGYGYMGSAFAARLKSFGVNIITYDKYKSGLSNDFVTQVEMDKIFQETDVLSIHLPLTPETRNLVNESYIEKFEKPFYLVNTARGEIVSLKALEYYLDKKIILGAALDVLEQERISELSPQEVGIFESLMKRTNLLVTPHVAGWSHQSYVRINKILIDKIQKYLLE